MASRRRKRRPERPPVDLTAERRILDRGIEHATYLERFAAGESRRVADHVGGVVNRIVDATRGRIERLSSRGWGKVGPWGTKTYAETIQRIGEEIDSAAQEFEKALRVSMLGLAATEAAWQASVIEDAIPQFSLHRPPRNIIRAAAIETPIEGRHLADWRKGLSQSTTAKVRQVVSRGLTRGTPTPQIVREMKERILQSARQAEAVARTALTHASSAGREALYNQNPDICIGVVWVSVLDSRTTVQCMDLDGQVFAVNTGPRPPVHVRCRSSTVPLTRDPGDVMDGKKGPATKAELERAAERRYGGRAAIDYRQMSGTVLPVKTTFGQWIKSQPATIQDRVLGRTRARLLRAGKLEVGQFTGRDYQPLTLRQLVEMERLTAADLRAVGFRAPWLD